jgi:HEAT repeat protein
MAIALIQQRSTIERLRGVEWASRLEQPDDAILAALLHALDSDPNVNVRLAAVEALLPFARQTSVRRALLDSLPRQQSPLVQVELIDLMVGLEERGLVPVLESLIDNPELNETVRERAKQGLAEFG